MCLNINMGNAFRRARKHVAKKSKYKTQTIPLNFVTGFFKLVSANTNRSATLRTRQTGNENVYFWFDLTASKHVVL